MNRIKQLREETNITLRKLGQYVNISPTVLNYLNNDNRAARQIHIEKLCSFFKVTADYLLGKSDIGYIVYLGNKDESIVLSSEDYKKLKENITISFLKNNETNNTSLIGGKPIEFSKYYIRREFKENLSDYKLRQTTIYKINNLLLSLNNKKLNSVTKFIEDLIKNNE